MASFEDLLVYRRSVSLADDLREFIRAWPELDRRGAGGQLLRAADSVGANLAEGYERSKPADRLQFIVVARGSAYETQHWIARAVVRSLSLPEKASERAADVGRLLNQLLKAWA